MSNKIKALPLILLVALVTFSFTEMDEKKKEIKTDKSKVTWKGHKVTGSHDGTIKLQSGFLNFDDNGLQGGEFVIDMKSIENTDLEGEYKGKLENHLKSEDFFEVEKFPTATLVIKSAEKKSADTYTVKGDITIKGITETISFDLAVKGNKATADMKIDRSKFNVTYKSPSFFDDLKDKAIYDEFDLIAELQF